MWDNLLRVDWGRLTHAYGRAGNMPKILRDMIADDEKTRAKGWDAFWGAINHQGDYYDSTVAAIPFLIEAVAHPGMPERERILYYFRERWLDAPIYSGDPLVTEPPGGTDIPTPMLTDAEVSGIPERAVHESAEDGEEQEFDLSSYRRMDLCAWQTGRAILSGQPTFVKLLDDPDREVATAAAVLLLLWSETRHLAKQTLIRRIAEELNPVEQGRRILEFGVYAANEDVGTLTEWIAPHRPAPMRAAASLVWAWLVNPGPLSEPAIVALRDTSVPDSDAWAKLPWVGVYHRGPWILPCNAVELILRLAENNAKEARWRAVQGLVTDHEPAKHLSAAQVVPVLIKRLSDDYNRIRAAATLALSQRGESVLDIEPNAIPILIGALEKHKSRNWGDGFAGLDADTSICGHAARLLATLSHRLTPRQRKEASAGIDRAIRRYAGRTNEYVSFRSLGVQADSFLGKQRDLLLKPAEWGLAELFEEFAFASINREDRRLSTKHCDRRLADVYSRHPEQTIAGAIQCVRTATDRNTAMGAALWLMTLGPAAETALEALEVMANGQLDPYAREQARAASTFIRQSLQVAQDVGGGSISEEPTSAIHTSEQVLIDETFAEVGIFGEYECEGRLYHWRREHRSPRAGAIRTFFAGGRIPEGDRMLQAMLAESAHAKVICAKSSEPQRFPIAHWRLAVNAAGGLSRAEPLIRAAQQDCQTQPWPGNNAPYVCAAELAEVIRQLSGRLIQ